MRHTSRRELGSTLLRPHRCPGPTPCASGASRPDRRNGTPTGTASPRLRCANLACVQSGNRGAESRKRRIDLDDAAGVKPQAEALVDERIESRRRGLVVSSAPAVRRALGCLRARQRGAVPGRFARSLLRYFGGDGSSVGERSHLLPVSRFMTSIEEIESERGCSCAQRREGFSDEPADEAARRINHCTERRHRVHCQLDFARSGTRRQPHRGDGDTPRRLHREFQLRLQS